MLDYTQLETLLAVKREGSFEKAGRALGISPIAIARRVEKLGDTLSATLLSRKPTRPTKAGDALCVYAEQIEAIERKSFGLLPKDQLSTGGTINIAISADSLAGWFHQVLTDYMLVHERPTLDITVVDPDHSIELMKSGKVIAGLSGTKQPIYGFKAFRLGNITHRASSYAGLFYSSL